MANVLINENTMTDIADAIREKLGVSDTYKPAEMPDAIASISGGGSDYPLDPVEVYKNTRPADWLPMPTPNDNELYALVLIPEGASTFVAFSAVASGGYTVEIGTVVYDTFVPNPAFTQQMTSGASYENEIFASSFGNTTSNGMKQAMFKFSGNITSFSVLKHSRINSGKTFAVDICGNLPLCTSVIVNNISTLKYFSLIKNNVSSMNSMFNNCYSLVAIPQIDTSNVTNAVEMFNNCYSLVAIPQLDTSRVTSLGNMFYNCYSLVAIPQIDTSRATSMDYMFGGCNSLISIPQLDMGNVSSASNMFNGCSSLASIPQLNTNNLVSAGSLFYNCNSLISIPQLNTSKVTSASNMFRNCTSLVSIPQLDTSKMSNVSNMFNGCYSLSKLILSSTTAVANMDIKNTALGYAALIAFFNSLPTVTTTRTLTITGTPGSTQLTDADKAIVTNKGWTLTV